MGALDLAALAKAGQLKAALATDALVEVPPTAEGAKAMVAAGKAANDAPPTWAPRLVTVPSSWVTDAPPPREYLAIDVRTGRGALPRRGCAVLGAAGGAGKSFATVGLICATATGRPWLGTFRPEAGRVLVVSAEDDVDEYQRRVHACARADGISSLPENTIDIIDAHDARLPFLDKNAEPTAYHAELVALIRERGPYRLVIVDPIARIAGARIDVDNDAASALVSALEALATAAGGLVLAVHHTSQEARRKNIVDATALRGATGFGDGARFTMILTVEALDHGDDDVDDRLGEVLTVTCAKSNHVMKWKPLELRRGEGGVLVPLDGADVAMVRDARGPSKREAAREERRQVRRAEVCAAIRVALRESPGLTYRGLRDVVASRCKGCSDPVLADALAVMGAEVRTVPGDNRATHHYLAEVDA